MVEIVAAKINGGTITNNLATILQAAKNNQINEIYNRKQMQLMSACDLGKKWDMLANGATLFIVGDDGIPQWPNRDTTERLLP